MKYIATFVIDSWHLANGIHCPSYRSTGICDTEDEMMDLLIRCVLYDDLEDAKHTPINEEYIRDKMRTHSDKHLRIPFEYPREGEINIHIG